MPYRDYGNFDERYFEEASVSDPNGAGYTDYQRDLLPFDYYARKLNNELQSRNIDPSKSKVLVVGCAYGYTVEYLIDNFNVDAYGMDVSSWAVNQADSEIAYGGRIYQGDVLNSSDLQNVRQSTQGGQFDVLFNECVLECLTDSEAETAATNMRNEAKEGVVQRVWTDGRVATNYYNTKTISQWQNLCDPDGQDYWFTEEQFQPWSNG